MAKTFEDKLYAIVERRERTKPEALERFKALGEAAWVIGDLDDEAHLECYLDDIQKLMKSCGVSPPEEQKVSPFWWLWPDTCLVYRDFTVGELKTLAQTKIWPSDAYTYEKNSLTQKLTSLTVMLVLVGLVIGIVALLGFWIVHWLR